MIIEKKFPNLIFTTFYQVFEDVVKQYKLNHCLYDNGYYTYEQINQKVDLLAIYLKNNFAEGTRVGLYFFQSLDYIVSFLAVMKSGCTFVPLSALNNIPDERLKQYLDCEIKLILTTSSLQNRISKFAIKTIVVEKGNILTKLNNVDQNYSINIKYRYDPEDVLGILQARIKQSRINQCNLPNICSPDLNWIIGNHDISLHEYLKFEKNNHVSYKQNRTLLIPYRISSIHWVGILIHINSIQNIDKVILVDSAKKPLCFGIITEDIRSCSNLYGSLKEIIIEEHRTTLTQHDFTGCGPLVIENLLLLANIESKFKEHHDNYSKLIVKIRKLHIDCYKHQQDFLNKQNNDINISLEQLLMQADKFLFDVHEKNLIIETIFLIKKMVDKKDQYDLLIQKLELSLEPHKFCEAISWIQFVLKNDRSEELDKAFYIKSFDLIRLFITTNKIRYPAYILNTSGSTGVPKKVAIQHEGLKFCMLASHDFLKITVKDRVAAFADIGFDAHIFDIMMALGKGSCLYIVPHDIRTNIVKLGQFYYYHQISITVFTPSILQELNPKNFPYLRVLLSTGEILDPSIIKNWKSVNKNILFVNGYGPSEVTIATTMGICETGKPSHIGTAIPGLEIFILEKEPSDPKAPSRVKPGEEGELYITGYGVSRLGYIDNPALTKERFVYIKHPDHGKIIRCFCTKDLAKIDVVSGLTMIVGRIDRQCKINGKLCCPEEIESQIKSNDSRIVRVYVSIVETTITAYIQLNPACVDIDENTLQTLINVLHNKIANKLPLYMLPSRWIFVQNMQLNNSGKIDANYMLLLDKTSKIYFVRDEQRMLPINLLQHTLSGFFKDILNLEQSVNIFIDDRFDQLGGSSLNLETLFTKIQQQFNVEMISRQRQNILQEPTIRNIEQQILMNQNNKKDPIVLLNPLFEQEDHRPIMFLVHSVTSDVVQDYYRLATQFSDFRLYGISYPRLYKESYAIDNFFDLAQEYISYIKAIQKTEPYFIVGWSLGGLIALEMASQLEYAGEKAHAIMLDTKFFDPDQSEYEHAQNLVELFNNVKVVLGLQDIKINIENLYDKNNSKNNSKKDQINKLFLHCLMAILQKHNNQKIKLILSIRNLLIANSCYILDTTFINCLGMVVAKDTIDLCANNEFNILPRLHKNPEIVTGNHFDILFNDKTHQYVRDNYKLMQQILIFKQNIFNILPTYLQALNISKNIYDICRLIFNVSHLTGITYINQFFPNTCHLVLLDALYKNIDGSYYEVMMYNHLRDFFVDEMYDKWINLFDDEEQIIFYLDDCLSNILDILCKKENIYKYFDLLFVSDLKNYNILDDPIADCDSDFDGSCDSDYLDDPIADCDADFDGSCDSDFDSNFDSDCDEDVDVYRDYSYGYSECADDALYFNEDCDEREVDELKYEKPICTLFTSLSIKRPIDHPVDHPEKKLATLINKLHI